MIHQPSVMQSGQAAIQASRCGVADRDRRTARIGQVPALLQPAPLRAEELRVLRGWLVGACALRPSEAGRLLDRALDQRQLVDEPAAHWRAVKAWIAGESNWSAMGFKLNLDEPLGAVGQPRQARGSSHHPRAVQRSGDEP